MIEGITLDTGALLAVERGDPKVRALLERAIDRGADIHVPAGVVAQAWRGGARQARLASLLNSPDIDIPPLDHRVARAVGVLCGHSGHADVIDVHVVLNARLHHHQVVTTDPGDLLRIDPTVPLIAI